MRAIAVLVVVGFHAFPEWLSGGLIGVDIFFVVSGFLISSIIIGSLKRGNFSFLAFYRRRIRRIFPALLVVLIACFAIGWVLLLADPYAQLSKHIFGAAGFISNFLLWGESGYFDEASYAKPLLHLWSLGIEEQFYLAWPLILWLAWLRKFNLLLVILLIGTISFALNVVVVRYDPVADFYSPYTRTWELLAGALLAYLAIERPRLLVQSKSMGDIFSTLGAALILAGTLAISRDRAFPGWWALLPVLGAILIISAGERAWLNRLVLAHPVLVWVGLISYPIYLWHWPLLSFARYFQDGEPSVGTRSIVVICSMVLAWLTYRLVELPLRFGPYGRTKAAALVGSMMFVGTIGLTGYLQNGFYFRFPGIVRDLATFSNQIDWTPYRHRSCFLDPDQDFSAFAACPIPQRMPDRPVLFLWGDSHAAHLYPGYLAEFGNDLDIVQRNASLCPPLLGLEMSSRPHCKSINDRVFNEIANLKPDTVVLAAAWPQYSFWADYLALTVERLRQVGVRRIDLVGPVPDWYENVPTLLFKAIKSDPVHRVPTRLTTGLKPDFFTVDKAMRVYAAKNSINYVSPTTILCNQDGCLTSLGDTNTSVVQLDRNHLTVGGSRYLVSHFPRD